MKKEICKKYQHEEGQDRYGVKGGLDDGLIVVTG
jgi:hypothetical protein